MIRKEWVDTTIGELAQINPGSLSARTPVDYEFGYIDLSMVDEGQIQYPSVKIKYQEASPRARRIVKDGDILLSTVRPNLKGFGRITVKDEDLICSTGFAVLRCKDTETSEYLYQYIFSDFIYRQIDALVVGSSYPAINSNDVHDLQISIPKFLPEQRKIAAILRTWDEGIERQDKIIQKSIKKLRTIELTIFENYAKNKKDLSDAEKLFEAVTEKKRSDLPLLAVTQDQGVIPRDKLDRRVVMPEGSVDGYKVVRKGDFVISLRSFEGGFEYSDYTGLISPAYTILRPKLEIDLQFFRFYFKSHSFVGRLSPLVFGIRDGKSIAFRDFGFMRIPFPPLNIQKKISALLTSLENEIVIQNKYLQALKSQKRGLMQKLLTGKWPVKISESEAQAC